LLRQAGWQPADGGRSRDELPRQARRPSPGEAAAEAAAADERRDLGYGAQAARPDAPGALPRLCAVPDRAVLAARQRAEPGSPRLQAPAWEARARAHVRDARRPVLAGRGERLDLGAHPGQSPRPVRQSAPQDLPLPVRRRDPDGRRSHAEGGLLGPEHDPQPALEFDDAGDRQEPQASRALSAEVPLGAVARIGIFGAGYVGLVTGACFADLGHEVVVRDVLPERIERLQAGEVPLYEPGLDELLERNRERVSYTIDVREAAHGADFLYVAVGTPPTYAGDADLSAVWTVIDELPDDSSATIVMKSTVPVGTGEKVRAALEARGLDSVGYVSNPEFTAEGTAVRDFMEPDRVVIGAFEEEDGDTVEALPSWS